MSNIKDNARQAFIEGLQVVTECKAIVTELQVGDLKDLPATTQTLIADTKVFMDTAGQIFQEGKAIVDKEKAEINSKEFQQFEVDFKGLKQNCQKIVSDITSGQYSHISDDVRNGLTKLQAVVQEASDLAKQFIQNAKGQDTSKHIESPIESVSEAVRKEARKIASEITHIDKKSTVEHSQSHSQGKGGPAL